MKKGYPSKLKSVIFPMMFKADLHCHSCYSDGTDTPQQLIDLAKERGLSGLSITDHDSIDAYQEAVPYAKEQGIRLLTGIEFSATYQQSPVHILGYNYDLENAPIQTLCKVHEKRRKERNQTILEKLKGLGYSFEYDQLLKNTKGAIVGRPHIAMLLKEAGVVATIKEAFDRFLGEGKAAFDPGKPIMVEETIETIKAAGGKALIAHPHLVKRSNVIRHLLTLPFDGLEVYYANFPLDQEDKWLRLAKEKNWLISGGSDYHGSVKPNNRLGSSWVDEEAFERLLA